MSAHPMFARTSYIGASEVGKLMRGDPDEVYELWQIKTEQIVEPDLTDHNQCDNWFQIGLGQVTEAYHLEALKITRPDLMVDPYDQSKGPVIYSGNNDWVIRATPDAYFGNHKDGAFGVLDAKHTNQFSKPEALYERYYWQMQPQMLCCDVTHALISPIYGNRLGDLIPFDACYPDQVIMVETIETFWKHVVAKTKPEVPEAKATPVMPSEFRKIKLEETNFGPDIEDLAPLWIEKREAKKEWEQVDKDIKGFMPEDVNEAIGYGLKITRSKPSKSRPKGSVTITATK